MSVVGATSRTLAGGAVLRGRLRVPGDKSVSHRALLLGALCEGRSVLRGLSDGDDVARTAAAVAAIGGGVSGGPGPVVVVEGGRAHLHGPVAPIDLGNSGTGLRLLAGLVAGFPWTVELTGDASLRSRPMDRVAAPLRLMGAQVHGQGERCLAPVVVRGGRLRGIDYAPPMASAQVKSCVLLAGLQAEGETVVREPVLTRVHTEELLALAGADVDEDTEPDGTHVVRLRPSRLRPFELDVPGDPSQAAFWVVAGCIVAGSDVRVVDVYVGPARSGFLDVLARMGARLDVERSRDGRVAEIRARSGVLRATAVDHHEIPSLDEVPVLAVAAAVAEGTTVFRGMGELRVKESDRLAGVVELVRAFGAEAEVEGDDLFVTGVEQLHGATVDARGDHRMAMAAAVGALAAPAGTTTEVVGFDAVGTSYPGFLDDLVGLAAPSSAGRSPR